MDLIQLGNTSNILRFILSSESTGEGLTGLTHSSSGLIISTICDNEATATTYTAAGSTIETISTLGTYATPTATKCRFKQVDSTNHPGLYEIQLADARFAVSASRKLIVTISGASDLLTSDYQISLVGYSPYDGASTVSIAPIQANVVNSLMVTTDINVYQTSEAPALTWRILDANNVPIDLSSATLSFKVYSVAGTTIFSKTTASGLTVSGSSSNIVTATYTATDTATAGGYLYMLWRTDGSDTSLAAGKFTIKPAVK